MAILKRLFHLSLIGAVVWLGGCRVPWTDPQDSDSDTTSTDTDDPVDAGPAATCPDGALDEFDNKLAPYLGGEEEVRVVVSIATDFHCPFCSNFAMHLFDLYSRPEYNKYVRLYYHHHPLNMHISVWDIHYAAAAVQLQSYEKFWILHDMLFLRENDGKRMTIDEVVEFVDKELDLDMKKFNEDRESKWMESFVLYEKQQAVDQGLTGTPSTWVCGTKVYWQDMEKTIESHLSGEWVDTDSDSPTD